MKKYLLVIEDAGENLSAYFPDVPGCVTTGLTIDDVRRHAAEALSLHLEDDEAPAARSLKDIVSDPELEFDGTEVLTWVNYEHEQALAPA